MKQPYSRKKRIDYKSTDFELIKDLTNQIIKIINPTPSSINEYLIHLKETNSLNWVINNFDLVIDSWENYSNQNFNFSDRENIYYNLHSEQIEEFSKQLSAIVNDPREIFTKPPELENMATSKSLNERIKKINLIRFNHFEIILLSIIFGTLIFLLLGYEFGSYRYKPKRFQFNFIVAISSFVISSGITYLLLNRMLKK